MKTMKHWRKKLKKTLEDGRNVHRLAELALWKWPYYQKQSIDSTQLPSKSQWHYSQTREKKHLKFTWKHKRPQTAKAILSKKGNSRGITIPNFKLYYKATATKTAWYKDRHIDHWNRTDKLKLSSHSYCHVPLNKSVKNIH
jgi:hypothetical protein